MTLPPLLTGLESVRLHLKPVTPKVQGDGFSVSFLGRNIYVSKYRSRSTWRLKTKVDGSNYERVFKSQEQALKACEAIMIKDLMKSFVAITGRGRV